MKLYICPSCGYEIQEDELDYDPNPETKKSVICCPNCGTWLDEDNIK